MNRLAIRLSIILLATVLVGLSLLDVAFVFYAQRQEAQAQGLELELCAERVARLVSEDVGRAQLDLVHLGEQYNAVVALQRRDGRVIGSAPLPLPPGVSEPRQRILYDGRAYFSLHTPASPVVARVLTARPLTVSVARVMGSHLWALGILGASGLCMVMVGFLFLRRAVLGPLRRVTDLVGNADYDGLQALGALSSDSFAQLSRAIASMHRRIEGDRRQIAGQLAQLESAHIDLQRAQSQLVRAERLAVVGQLAAGLAHEIGNPLAIVRGFLDLLLDDDSEREARHKAQRRMSIELDRISSTLRALLDFSRAPSGTEGEGDLGEALEHLRGLLTPQERFRGIALDISELAEGARVELSTDSLVQVLLNLCLNAADALGGSGRLSIHAHPEPTAWVVHVDDDGPGVDPSLTERIFEPFFTTKEPGQGTGLGLAVCDQIVSQRGGEMRVTQSPLGGARFTLWVPKSPTR